jgi:hypothetical protein
MILYAPPHAGRHLSDFLYPNLARLHVGEMRVEK